MERSSLNRKEDGRIILAIPRRFSPSSKTLGVVSGSVKPVVTSVGMAQCDSATIPRHTPGNCLKNSAHSLCSLFPLPLTLPPSFSPSPLLTLPPLLSLLLTLPPSHPPSFSPSLHLTIPPSPSHSSSPLPLTLPSHLPTYPAFSSWVAFLLRPLPDYPPHPLACSAPNRTADDTTECTTGSL